MTRCRTFGADLVLGRQVLEWLTFKDGKTHPFTRAQWRKKFRERHNALNRRYGFPDTIPCEIFRVTRWARTPRHGEIEQLFPKLLAWRGDGVPA